MQGMSLVRSKTQQREEDLDADRQIMQSLHQDHDTFTGWDVSDYIKTALGEATKDFFPTANAHSFSVEHGVKDVYGDNGNGQSSGSRQSVYDNQPHDRDDRDHVHGHDNSDRNHHRRNNRRNTTNHSEHRRPHHPYDRINQHIRFATSTFRPVPAMVFVSNYNPLEAELELPCLPKYVEDQVIQAVIAAKEQEGMRKDDLGIVSERIRERQLRKLDEDFDKALALHKVKFTFLPCTPSMYVIDGADDEWDDLVPNIPIAPTPSTRKGRHRRAKVYCIHYAACFTRI